MRSRKLRSRQTIQWWQRLIEYLQSRQQIKLGDWALDTPKIIPGGWGFSDKNTMNPDIDDTTASLRAIARSVPTNPNLRLAWEKGLSWLVSMQNNDGGWASFERNKNNRWLRLLPLEKGEFMFIDPSSVDLTGRTLEFLGGYTKLAKESPFIKKAVDWILHHQEKNGSWYGRWGICYLYGTWVCPNRTKSNGNPSKASIDRKSGEMATKHPKSGWRLGRIV